MEGDDLELAADLIRLKGVADELLKSSRKPQIGTAQDAADRMAVSGQLDRLSKVIAKRLDSSPDLGAEFGSLVPEGSAASRGEWGGEAVAATIAGWLAGAIAGKSLRARLAAEARAYAAERVKQERAVGFSAPAED
jgi:hypothetical protein